jgi:hypothetical protein
MFDQTCRNLADFAPYFARDFLTAVPNLVRERQGRKDAKR